MVGISKKLNYLSILKKDFADAAAVSRIEGEVAGGGGGMLIPPRPDYSESREDWVCSKFGFVRSFGLFEVWVCSTPTILGSIGVLR